MVLNLDTESELRTETLATSRWLLLTSANSKAQAGDNNTKDPAGRLEKALAPI